MATGCHTQLGFKFRPKIVLDFHGGENTTDTGLLLLREFDQQLALTKPMKGLYHDWRSPIAVDHHTHEMLGDKNFKSYFRGLVKVAKRRGGGM